MLPPIEKAVVVPCDQQLAFEVFVDDMASWWPLHQRSVSMIHGNSAVTLRVDPREGGQIIEISDAGDQHLWGAFSRYSRFDYVSMDFHMGMPADMASFLEIRFEAIDDKQTRVKLRQSNWEAFGDLAEAMFDGYQKGWEIIFEQAYLSVCQSRAATAGA